MPEESIWGKNAVDATRKNSLPQYIDDTIGEVKGQYVKKSGDTMTGPLIQRSGVIDINITPSATQWDDQYQLKDKNGKEIGAIYAIRTNNDLLGIQMEVSRVNLAGKRINNNIRLYLNNDGVQSVEVANAAAWRTALSVLPLSGGTLTGNLTITSGKLITPNNTLNTIGDDVEIGDGNVAGCLVIHGLNGATGISFKPYSGSTEQRITTNGNGTMTITGGDLNASAGAIWAGTLGNTTSERQIGAQSGAGRIYFYATAPTTGNRGIWATNHEGTGHYFLYCGQDNLIHSNAYSSAVSGTCVRDIQVQDSASNSVSTKYIIMKRG